MPNTKLKINHKFQAKVNDRIKERMKRENDFKDNQEHMSWEESLLQDLRFQEGEYSKNLAKQKRRDNRLKIYLGIIVGILVVIIINSLK